MQESDCIISLDIISISNDYIIEGLCNTFVVLLYMSNFFQKEVFHTVYMFAGDFHGIIKTRIMSSDQYEQCRMYIQCSTSTAMYTAPFLMYCRVRAVE